MAFSDRFMKVPIFMINAKADELMGKDSGEGDMARCIMKINPRRIETYSETIPQKDFDPDNKIWTNVVMESGDSFIVRITLDKFEELLNNFSNT